MKLIEYDRRYSQDFIDFNDKDQDAIHVFCYNDSGRVAGCLQVFWKDHDEAYYATKEFVRSFSEAVSEEVKGTGVIVTAFCPGPTATGFEQAAAMDKGSTMFRKADKAEDVAKGGIRAMMRGKELSYYGVYTKCMSFMCRLVPRQESAGCKIILH